MTENQKASTLPTIIREGPQALAAHKSRALFMMTSMAVGVAALTILIVLAQAEHREAMNAVEKLMAIGKGAQPSVKRRVMFFSASRTIMVVSGTAGDRSSPDMTVTTLKPEDSGAILANNEGIDTVSPMVCSSQMSIRLGAKEYKAVVWGICSAWHRAWDWHVSPPEKNPKTWEWDEPWMAHSGVGREIVDTDVVFSKRVCVIGDRIRCKHFGLANPPVGQFLSINGVSLQIVGVLERRGVSPAGEDFDNCVLLPITTARGVMNTNHLTAIRIVTKNQWCLGEVKEAVRALLRDRHHIAPGQTDDFRLVTANETAELAGKKTRTLRLALMGVAALGFVVGAVMLIGIMHGWASKRKRRISQHSTSSG